MALGGLLLAVPLLLAGCTARLAPDEPLTPQFAESGCLADCRATRAACDREARHAWRDCQAGYAASFEDYRWCLAAGGERRDCGYPWWSCAENGYRACREDQQGCERACDTSGAVAWRPPGAEG